MAKVKSQKSKVNVVGGHKLLLSSLKFLKDYRRRLFGVIAVAWLVNFAIGFVVTSQAASLYQSVWFGFASCSLIWMVRHATQKQQPKLGQAYWTGSAPALKFLIIAAVITLLGLPFSIGAFVYSVVSTLAVGSGMAKLITGLIWLVLGLLSLVLVGRFVVAPIVVTLPDINPVLALRISWRLTKKQTYVIVERLLVVLLYSLLFVLLVSYLINLLPLDEHWLAGLADIASFGVVLPLFYIFLFQLYGDLVAKSKLKTPAK